MTEYLVIWKPNSFFNKKTSYMVLHTKQEIRDYVKQKWASNCKQLGHDDPVPWERWDPFDTPPTSLVTLKIPGTTCVPRVYNVSGPKWWLEVTIQVLETVGGTEWVGGVVENTD